VRLNGDNTQKIGIKHNNGRDSAIKGVEFKLDNPQATTHNTMLGWLIK
jgi:hypothetical protein